MVQTNEDLIDTYLLGFKEKSIDKFQTESFPFQILQSAYNLGRAHNIQGKILVNNDEIIDIIHKLYEKTNYDYF